MFRSFISRVAVTLGIVSVLLVPAGAYAATDPFQNACSAGGSSSTICQTKGNTEDPLTGPNGTIVKATNVIAIVAGIMAVIFMILSGIKYITSGGDPSQVSKAKESVIYGLVGIVVIVLARSLIGWVLSKL